MKPTWNKIYLYSILILLLYILILSGCNQNSDQNDFHQQAFSEPSGITETGQNGEVLRNDPDDWRIAPFYQGDVELIPPPYPNPVQTNELLRIEIQVYFLDRIGGIYIYVNRPSGFARIVDPIEQVNTGANNFRIEPILISGPNPNPEGIYRIIILDENDNVITYGDVEIK